MASLLIAVIYLVFVSLGLPDSLLGSAWPTMQIEFNVPSSYAGYISMFISFLTIISSLFSPKLIKRFETKRIVIVSIALTIIGLLGFSITKEYMLLFLFAIPYGLGAGAIDSSVNYYVANHYSSSVMNFLHCFYGVGAVISPNIMALALKYAKWNKGYSWTAILQFIILIICILSFPLWKQNEDEDEENNEESIGIKDTLKVPGVLLTLIGFYAYCAGEATCFLWTSSYFAGVKQGLSNELIASFASLIFGGLMLGRLISGFISNNIEDKILIRIGIAIEIIGIVLVMLPIDHYIVAAIGFVVIGIGMGPIYPSVQHMAPINFGKKYSASVIALQMASAYVGSTFMPMIFGILQEAIGIHIMPIYLLIFAILNIVMLELAYKSL